MLADTSNSTKFSLISNSMTARTTSVEWSQLCRFFKIEVICRMIAYCIVLLAENLVEFEGAGTILPPALNLGMGILAGFHHTYSLSYGTKK